MKCSDFEARWNALLDEPHAPSMARMSELNEHAAGCDACRPIALRYQTLLHVLSNLGPAPTPSLDFVDRCLAAVEQDQGIPPSRARVFTFRRLVPLAAAAALLLGTFATVRLVTSSRKADPILVDNGLEKPAGDTSFSEALALAGNATWDLARESSGSAARIGREVLESASIPPDGSISLSVSAPSASDVLEGVSHRVNEGVEPLSNSARHAFGFLLGAAKVDAVPPT